MAKPVPYDDDDEKTETAESVLQRLRDEAESLRHWEAEDIVKKFPDEFAYGWRYFAGDDTVARSNTRVWRRDFKGSQNVDWWDAGDGFLIRLDDPPTPEQEAFDALENYPLLDDDDHSQLEQEEQVEQWNDWGRDDFKRALKKYVEENAQDEQTQKAIDELLEIIGNEDFDRAFWEMCSDAQEYPEGGDDIRFPDPETLDQIWVKDFTERKDGWWAKDGSFKKFLTWFGNQPDTIIVRLSSKAFCRLHVDDKNLGYRGAQFIKFGDEYVLNIEPSQVPEPVRDLVRKHADDSAQCIYDCASMKVEAYGFIDVAPGSEEEQTQQARIDDAAKNGITLVTGAEFQAILSNPFLEVELVVVDEWLSRYFHEDIDQKYLAEAQEFAESAVGDRSPATGKVWGLKQPNDLVEKVVEVMLRPSSDYERTAAGAKAALEEIRQSQPPVCDFRQLKLPHVSEKKRRRKR